MKEFQYNIVTLIQCVRDRPCLWDKTLDSFKDRVERRTAWEQIFNILNKNYEQMLPEEKRAMEDIVHKKWANVRDTFVKTLRARIGRPKKRYVFHDHLKFLRKLHPEEENPCDVTQYSKDEDELDYVDNTYHDASNQLESDQAQADTSQEKKSKNNYLADESTPQTSSNEDYNSKRRSKKNKRDARNSDSGNDLDFVDVSAISDPRIMNEDEAFFASLLPTVVKYNEDERLEFRIEVLAVMKRIKNNRHWPRDD